MPTYRAEVVYWVGFEFTTKDLPKFDINQLANHVARKMVHNGVPEGVPFKFMVDRVREVSS